MKYSLATLALSGLATAASVPRDSCTCKFTLAASGGQTGIVGQLSDGQNRIEGGNPTGEYCISNGQITDSQGRGCILTPPTTQFQCDTGATPTGGFSLGSNGQVEYNGSQTFYACPATNSMYNIYTTPVSGQDKCVKIELTASDCYAKPSTMQPVTASSKPAMSETVQQSQTQTVVKTIQPSCPAPSTVTAVKTIFQTAQASCPAPSTVTQTMVKTAEATCPAPSTVTVTKPAVVVPPTQPASSTMTPTPGSLEPVKASSTMSGSSATTTSSGKTCPVNLSGSYQYPHLIVPVSKSHPNTAYGTSYNGTITSDISSIYNFDVPSSYSSKTCSLIFLFPTQSQLETSSYTFSGPGTFDFAELSAVASESTDYANMGSVEKDFGTQIATPGSEVLVSSFECPAGKAVSYEISSVGGSSLSYFQDYNPSPIGLYITSC